LYPNVTKRAGIGNLVSGTRRATCAQRASRVAKALSGAVAPDGRDHEASTQIQDD